MSLSEVLRTVNKKDILVLEGRQRGEENELGDAESEEETDIHQSSKKASIGQIQTIAVYKNPDPAGPPYVLLAGKRRMRLLASEEVHIRIYPEDLSELDKTEIELTENIARRNLDWKEVARATKRMHELQQKRSGGAAPGTEGYASIAKTADIVGASIETTHKEIKLADALEVIPELEKCKSASEAQNYLAQLEEKLLLKEMAKRVKILPKDELKQALADSYKVGDFFEQVRKLPPEVFSFVELDPPYDCWFEERSALASGDSDASAELKKESFQQLVKPYPMFLEDVLTELDRVVKPNAWLLCWFAQEGKNGEPWGEVTFEALVRHGWKGMRIPAIWFKEVSGRVSSYPDKYLGRTYEPFFYMTKGNASISTRARSDVFVQKIPSHKERIHPTEKPVALMREILKTFGRPGETIIVPFAGSGNTLMAAAHEKMTAIGFDSGQEFKDKYLVRLQGWEFGT